MKETDSYLARQAIVNAASVIMGELVDTANRRREPDAVFRPRLSLDGNRWCALYGDNLQDGVAGFGASPEEAMLDFNANWSKQLDAPAVGAFQAEVHHWMLKCFGEEITADGDERNHRFLEEALELVQSTGCTVDEAHQLVDYVFGRPVGEPPQECGGVMVTLAAWCIANKLDMQQCARSELDRIWLDIPKIRAKQAAKPRHSPLPQ